MYPELFEIPFIHLTIKSYGLMMVIGFLACVSLIRHLSRDFTPNPQLITNAALYALVGGVVGGRLFFVVHYFDKFRSNPLEVFAIWHGGLELAGGVLAAIIVILFYLRYHKLPIRRYLDVLAVGLMLALVFGRIGCVLNGCCYGKPTERPWGIRFPYNSFAYNSQINANPERNRQKPQLILPKEEYLHHFAINGKWYPKHYDDLTVKQKIEFTEEYLGYLAINGKRYPKHHEDLTVKQKIEITKEEYIDYLATNGKWYPKHYDDLTVKQQIEVTEGKYRCLAVHPTQLFSSAIAAFWCLMLYLFWRRSKKAELSGNSSKFFTKPGYTFALMFIVYGITRFLMEFIRDDNPFEFDGLTISQNIGIAMIALGVIIMAIFKAMKVKDLEF